MKINSKLIKALYIRVKTLKLLEENIGQTLHDIVLGNDILDKTSKTQETIAKIDKKQKGFFTAKKTKSKETTDRMGATFANYASDKELIFM
jgi:hypothetical protein